VILVSDCHVTEQFSDDFFAMLDHLDGGYEPIIFLGDIFDLWIAYPRYERGIHRRFLAWCRHQHRLMGWVEGNHEFFVKRQHADVFSWATETEHRDIDVVFSHGDLINSRDHRYRFFRTVVRHSICRTLIRWFPFGPQLAHRMRHDLERTNLNFRKSLPHKELDSYALGLAEKGIKWGFVGHFHDPYDVSVAGDTVLTVVPSWLIAQEVVLFDPDNGVVQTKPWRDIPAS
jgi:UDP-2,3-diacylglucosamine pyrophosphatase LpxH